MTWDAMLNSEARSVNSALARDNWWHAHMSPGSTGKWIRGSWDAAIAWSNRTRTAMPWESLTEAVAIDELRKGERSIYYPDFHAAGDVAKVTCPKDGDVTVGVEGYCDQCGFPFDGSPIIREDEK